MNMFEEIEKSKAELPKAKSINKKLQKIELNGYQIFSIIIFLIIFVLGIFLGNLFSTCSSTSAFYNGTCSTTEFNFSLMLFIWFCGLILCIFLFAIGHIIQLLNSINKKLVK